jgi:tryptophan-rich sensory protein
VNFLWPLVFFGLRWYLAAFFVLLVLWALIFLTMRSFSKIDEKAGDLLLPYLIWVSFAGYLNIGVWLLN